MREVGQTHHLRGNDSMVSKIKRRRSSLKDRWVETAAAHNLKRLDLRNNWIAPAWMLITAFAAIVFVVVASFQWKTLSRIEHLLNVTQRPWVAASIAPIGLTFDDQGGALTLRVTIKNSGAVPAIDVLASSILLLRDPQPPYKKACSQYGVGGGPGPTLFKDDVFAKISTASLSRVDFGQHFPSLVAVCIKYRFANSSQTGETGYLFSIVRHDPPHPDLYFIESKNGTLSPPELALLPAASYHY